MQVPEFTTLIQRPEELKTPVQCHQLDELVQTYPWFQAARALHLKALHNLNSYKYNQALKVAAACTADREVLFDFITSEEFLQNRIADTISGKATLNDTEIISEAVEAEPEPEKALVAPGGDEPLPRSAADADRILDPQLFRSSDPDPDVQKAETRLNLGAPLTFRKGERYSFSQWLQLTSFSQAEPQAPSETPESEPQARTDPDRLGKFERIDKFIAGNPKIIPDPKAQARPVNIEDSLKLDREELMTETLARVYLEQGKLKKAIQAYRILSLKYPEKSGFFADQIKAAEMLRDKK